jgi:peptidoglycan/xylan/chitin deacetylase (PgdA/CDA1 family)
MILYTDDPGDYTSPGTTKIEDRVLDKIGDGGIILLHDGIHQTIDILPQIIKRLKERGFTFVTVDQMLDQSPRSAGFQPTGASLSLAEAPKP